MPTREPEVIHGAPVGADGPTALVAMGHAVLKIENETLAQVAIQRPRDEGRVLSGALKELEMVPDEAHRAYYEIPYRDTAPGGEQRMVKVTGPSIKAATALARRWGNCSATARILGEDGDSIEMEGVFIDYETSVRFTRPLRVSKYMKTRRGVILLDPKRLETAVAAGASKAMRNAILTGLPAYLVSAYDRKAREIAGGKAEAPLDAKTRAAIIRTFGEFKVTEQQLGAYLEKPPAEWTGSDRASLIGVYNALKDGQTTVEEVFGGGASAETTAPVVDAATTLTPDSLMTAEVTGQDGEDPGRAPAPEPEPVDAPARRKKAIAAIVKLLNGLPTDDARKAVAKDVFGVTTRAEIENLPLAQLEGEIDASQGPSELEAAIIRFREANGTAE
jgi:hypothetical protein